MKKLMTHLYWGDPNKQFSSQLARTLVDSGADILEIGVPYTDPMCDGPVFQRACHRAIAAGTTPQDVFEGIEQLRNDGVAHPIYLTGYFGPIFKMGLATWMKKAQAVGVQGLIIPDILLEEQYELRREARKHNLSVIQFATVYSSAERLKQIVAASTDLPAQAGFIYCIALPGVTGDVAGEREKLKKLIQSIKRLTALPIYVGFGIRNADDAKEILSFGADGIIVGSAIASLYEKCIGAKDVEKQSLRQVSVLVRSLVAAFD